MFADVDIAPIIETWKTSLVLFLPRLVLVAIILAITLFAAGRVQFVVNRLVRRTEAPHELGTLFGRVARMAIITLGAIAVLWYVGLGGAALSFVTGLGIAGIVIGFALQDIVKQIAAGILLLALRPFRVGDVVRVTGFEGTVQEIQFRATVLKTVEGDEVLIPNADVYNNAVVNRSKYDIRRRTLTVRVPRTADFDTLRDAVIDAVAAVPGVDTSKRPALIGTGLDDTALLAELRMWVDVRAADADAVTTRALEITRETLQRLGAQDATAS